MDGKWIEWMWMWKVASGAVPDLTLVVKGRIRWRTGSVRLERATYVKDPYR